MKKTFNCFLVLGLLFCISGSVASQQNKHTYKKPSKLGLQSKDLTAEQIAKKFLPSVVLVFCDDGKGTISQGSGFFVEPGQILTNYHVVEGMVRGKVKVAIGGKEAKEWWVKRILYVDSKNDLALFSIFDEVIVDPDAIDFSKPYKTQKGDKFDEFIGALDGKKFTKNDVPLSLDLVESDSTTIGQAIYVLSNPEGLTGSISKGIVSSSLRKLKGVEMIQFDAPISPGSSGGAVLNGRGEVIGIATASLSSGQNLNFAIPSSTIRLFVSQYHSKGLAPSQVPKSSLANAWLMCSLHQTLDSNPVINGAEVSFSLLTEKIKKIIQNTHINFVQNEWDKRTMESDINFSGCHVEYFQKYRALTEGMADTTVLWTADISHSKGIDRSKVELGRIELSFERNEVIRQISALGKVNEVARNKLSIQADWNNEPQISEIIVLLGRLEAICKER